ncbi:MAG: AraC family transcriptional regulator [Clostridium perfringens]|nr:AraC family transcriptional regulator [Clostridium perfringens]
MQKNFNPLFHSVLKTFSLSTNLPIICIDEYKQVINHYGFNNKGLENIDLELILKNLDINSIVGVHENLHFLKLSSNDEFAILFTPLDLNKNYIFIVGPYTSIDNNWTLGTNNFKPRYCFKHLLRLLRDILIENIQLSSKEGPPIIDLRVKKAVEYIHNNYYKDLNIDSIVEDLNINKCYFCCIFKRDTGMTYSNFINKFRIEKSKSILKNKELSILDIAIAVGFNNQNYYSMAFKKLTGVTPSQYRKSLEICL